MSPSPIGSDSVPATSVLEDGSSSQAGGAEWSLIWSEKPEPSPEAADTCTSAGPVRPARSACVNSTAALSTPVADIVRDAVTATPLTRENSLAVSWLTCAQDAC